MQQTSAHLVVGYALVQLMFHTRGPASAKLRVPSAVLVLGTTRHPLSADRRSRVPDTVVTGTQSSARYEGAMHLALVDDRHKDLLTIVCITSTV